MRDLLNILRHTLIMECHAARQKMKTLTHDVPGCGTGTPGPTERAPNGQQLEQ